MTPWPPFSGGVPRRQRGFSLVAAIFLLVVLGSLGAVAVKLTGVQQQTVILALQGARAYAAARSGVEWAIYRALNGSCGGASLSLNEGGLAGFSVATACTATTHTEGSTTTTVFSVEAFAQSGNYGMPDYVSRRVRATVTDSP